MWNFKLTPTTQKHIQHPLSRLAWAKCKYCIPQPGLDTLLNILGCHPKDPITGMFSSRREYGEQA